MRFRMLSVEKLELLCEEVLAYNDKLPEKIIHSLVHSRTKRVSESGTQYQQHNICSYCSQCYYLLQRKQNLRQQPRVCELIEQRVCTPSATHC